MKLFQFNGILKNKKSSPKQDLKYEELMALNEKNAYYLNIDAKLAYDELKSIFEQSTDVHYCDRKLKPAFRQCLSYISVLSPLIILAIWYSLPLASFAHGNSYASILFSIIHIQIWIFYSALPIAILFTFGLKFKPTYTIKTVYLWPFTTKEGRINLSPIFKWVYRFVLFLINECVIMVYKRERTVALKHIYNRHRYLSESPAYNTVSQESKISDKELKDLAIQETPKNPKNKDRALTAEDILSIFKVRRLHIQIENMSELHRLCLDSNLTTDRVKEASHQTVKKFLKEFDKKFKEKE